MKILRTSTYNSLLLKIESLEKENRTLAEILQNRENAITKQKKDIQSYSTSLEEKVKELVSLKEKVLRQQEKLRKQSKEISHLEHQLRKNRIV